MEDLRLIISQNIVLLRKKSGLTQGELAGRLNYSDKAISKWERGESLPDIVILKEISDIFGVTVDYLLREEHGDDEERIGEDTSLIKGRIKRKHALITGMSILLVWVVATLVFVILDSALKAGVGHYLTFAYAVVASMVVWLIFNSIWHNRRRNYLIISLMMWSLLAAIHISVLCGGANLWQLYFLGIPGQSIIILWSKMGKKN